MGTVWQSLHASIATPRMQNLGIVLIVCVVLTLGGGSGQLTFECDLTTGQQCDGASTHGHASVLSTYLQLTANAGSQSGYYLIPVPSVEGLTDLGAPTGFELSMEIYITVTCIKSITHVRAHKGLSRGGEGRGRGSF